MRSMSVSVVWIDREHAKIFQISQEKMERKTIRSKHVEHHTHSIEDLDRMRFERVFFSDVAKSIEDASSILILGPGLAKHQFQTHLIEHHPLLAKRIAGCETVDHPTDAQIAAMAQSFFNLQSAAAASGC